MSSKITRLAGLLFICVCVTGNGLFFAFTPGCSHAPKSADVARNPKPQEDHRAQEYRKALELREDAPGQACPIFTALSLDTEFPLRQLAELRRYETCAPQSLPALHREAYPEWLQELALDVGLQLAQARHDQPALLELATAKSKQNLSQKEKVKWIQIARKEARKLKQSDKEEDLLRRLYLVAPRLDPDPRPKDYLSVARDFRNARQFSKARQYYLKVLKAKTFGRADKIQAHKGLRLAYKNSRRMDLHLQSCSHLVRYLRAAVKSHPRSRTLREELYDAETYHARALWTQGQAADARKIFSRLEKTMKGKMSLAELYWLQGRLAEEAGQHEDVARFMEAALNEPISNPLLRDRILWDTAWNERERGNLDRAVTLLTRIDEETQEEFTRSRALFWLGKTLSDLKLEGRAREVFEKLISLDPLGYYGLLAHRQLGKSISFAISAPNAAPVGHGVEIPLDTSTADWLYMVGERDVLAALVDAAAVVYRKVPEQNDEGWVRLFKYYARSGLYLKLYQSLGGLAPERRRSVLDNHPELLFPQPWSDEVKTASLQFGVGEDLIYAIMRQESAFDHRARSGADAFGLMQILPEVASSISSKAAIPYSQMEDLYIPQTNVLVGAAHLKDLLDRYGGRFVLAVAAYNANERAIRNWMETRYRGDTLEFIEEIPYEETRTYVRLVMRNLIFYSLLQSKSASIEFPSWVLKLDAS
ncbi:MAG: transglycosylase SLT domain-containing protein [Bdellovibrionales bacterium]